MRHWRVHYCGKVKEFMVKGRFIVVTTISRPEGLPNGPYSPRRGESATQCDRGRGEIGVLGTVNS